MSCEKVMLGFYLELLQWADSGVKTVLRQAAGQKVNPRLFWGLSVHLFRIHVEVLQHGKEAGGRVQYAQTHTVRAHPHQTLRSWQHTNLWEVGDVSLAEGHVFGLPHDVSVNNEHVGELGSEAQLDLSTAVKVKTHTLGKFWNTKKTNISSRIHLIDLFRVLRIYLYSWMHHETHQVCVCFNCSVLCLPVIPESFD